MWTNDVWIALADCRLPRRKLFMLSTGLPSIDVVGGWTPVPRFCSYWPWYHEAERGRCRTGTWLTGDSISRTHREEHGVIRVHQLTEMVLRQTSITDFAAIMSHDAIDGYTEHGWCEHTGLPDVWWETWRSTKANLHTGAFVWTDDEI